MLAGIGVCAVHWPLPLDPWNQTSDGLYTGGHVWAFRHISRMLTGQVPLSTSLDTVGYPDTWYAALVAWFPAAALTPLQAVDPIVAYNTGLVVSALATALATFALLVRVFRVDGAIAAVTSPLLAMCPYVLGVYASGQLEKAQLWVLPLCMLGTWEAMAGPRRVAGLALLWTALLVGAFSDPSLVAFAPIGVGTTGLWALWAGRKAPLRTLGCGLVAAAGCAVILLPALDYYSPGPDDPAPAYVPAMAPPLDRVPQPPPFAEPRTIVTGVAVAPPTQHVPPIHHMTYLGLPAVLLGLIGLFRRGRGSVVGWAMVVGGTTFAMGPYLIHDGVFATYRGQMIRMPAMVLEQLGYPTARSGMYYRAISIAALGVTIAAASACATLPTRWGRVAAALLLAVTAGDTWRATRGFLPVPVHRVSGRAALDAIRQDPAPGAVLALPFSPGERDVQDLMQDAALHDRTTSAFPNPRSPLDFPEFAQWVAPIDAALTLPTVRAREQALADLGYAFVTRRPAGADLNPLAVDIQDALGAPDIDGPIQVWRLDAAGTSPSAPR